MDHGTKTSRRKPLVLLAFFVFVSKLDLSLYNVVLLECGKSYLRSKRTNGEFGLEDPKPAKMPAAQGGMQHVHNWPHRMNWPQISQGRLRRRDKMLREKWFHVHTATGVGFPKTGGSAGFFRKVTDCTPTVPEASVQVLSIRKFPTINSTRGIPQIHMWQKSAMSVSSAGLSRLTKVRAASVPSATLSRGYPPASRSFTPELLQLLIC